MALVSDHENTQNPPNIQTLPAARIWEMLKAIDIAMLVTHSPEGPKGRPMSTIPTPEKGVGYQGRGDYVALIGQATVNPDQGLVKDLWNPGAEVFWPGGPEGHDIVALEIDPGHADVWDGPGILRGIAEIFAGAIKGKSPDLGTRGQAEL